MKYLSLLTLIIIFFASCGNQNKDAGKTNSQKKNEIKNFLFVGMIINKAGLYNYSFEDDTSSQFWSDSKDKVVELSYSEKRSNAFFITAENYGWSGAFPFINSVKLYIINPDNNKPEFVEEIGSGLQIFAQWLDENNFRIIVNSFDKNESNYVNHKVLLFNVFGKKIEEKTEIFDITKEGYPQPPSKKINYTSPDNEYSLITEGEDSISVYLENDGNKDFIIKTDQELKHIEWTNDFLFFSTINIKPENETLYSEDIQTSKLIIYSLKKKELVKLWNGSGVKNFFISNNKIVFDSGFEGNSYIIIYDFVNQEIINEIKIDGGCGIKNILQFPDHGA